MVLIFAVLRVHKNSKQEAFRQMNKRQKLMRLDPLGVITALGAITCALLALQWGGQSKAWNSSTVVGLLVGFVLLFGVFWIIQWHGGEYASLPVSVHRKRSIWSGAGFLFFMAMPAYVVRSNCTTFEVVKTDLKRLHVTVWILLADLLSVH